MASNSLPAAPASYTRAAVALHRLIALLIVCGFALGWVMTGIAGFTPTKLKYFSWHKCIGVPVFVLVPVPVLWRATHMPSPLPAGMPTLQRVGAHVVHMLLYAPMLAIPVTGYTRANCPGVRCTKVLSLRF